jgi:hypothetical protein
MLTVRLQLEIMATDPPPKKVLGPIQSPLYTEGPFSEFGPNSFVGTRDVEDC